ncbi:cytosolic beta-glucosidase [Exaiptasia diaphana]|uniref:Beta-glucosidase n=1 Tax=Exaiptasia diaphana TaxID=2652724 RepID=A0A913Y9V8_EXADI|nr:cytosolic beta-glucosidase [Exaiptasia diaphana]KXJ21201.1 Cytosolic beta-glucosidase [Exaiptasia diaphana]
MSLNEEEGDFLNDVFPDDFVWGAASSAYQVEGGWNEDGKGPSAWDTYTHHVKYPRKGYNGDIACDSYHKIDEDVALLKNLGVSHYRFSISWPRLLPRGTVDHVNPLGVQYYKKLIGKLLENNIQPAVTLYHFDLPQALVDCGGWLSRDVVDKFVEYARLCFQEFGENVKIWMTINEPGIYSRVRYGERGMLEPEVKAESGEGTYQAAHNMLLAHAKAWHVYDKEFRPSQNGKITIVLDSDFFVPKTESEADKQAAYRGMLWSLGWMADPVFKGDYPEMMKTTIEEKSRAKGLPCRLPSFSEEEKKLIKGTADFFSLNFYCGQVAEHVACNPDTEWGYETDQELKGSKKPHWEVGAVPLFVATPFALRKVLVWIKERYNNPDVMITENGFCCQGEEELQGPEALNDVERTDFIKRYLNEALKACKIDGVNLKGYFIWSLMDCFEWINVLGFNARFGIYRVDFESADRTRTPKKSAFYYKEIVANNGFKTSIGMNKL